MSAFDITHGFSTTLVAQHAEQAIAAVAHALAWPARVMAAKRAMHRLASLDDRELSDLGLCRQDIVDATALSLGSDPTAHLAGVVRERSHIALCDRQRARRP